MFQDTSPLGFLCADMPRPLPGSGNQAPGKPAHRQTAQAQAENARNRNGRKGPEIEDTQRRSEKRNGEMPERRKGQRGQCLRTNQRRQSSPKPAKHRRSCNPAARRRGGAVVTLSHLEVVVRSLVLLCGACRCRPPEQTPSNSLCFWRQAKGDAAEDDGRHGGRSQRLWWWWLP